METDAGAVVRTVEALLGAEPEVAEAFLLASVYVRCIRSGESPRGVAEALFKALPSSTGWPALRDSLLCLVEDGGG